KAVRVGFVVAALAGFSGVVLYGWLWALVSEVAPGSAIEAANRRRDAPGLPPTPEEAEVQAEAVAAGTRVRADLLAGAFLIAAGAVLLAAQAGWGWVQPGLVLPLLIVTAGAVIAYAQFDEVDRARWFARTGVGTRSAALRLAVGVLLVVLGVLLLVVQEANILMLGRTLL